MQRILSIILVMGATLQLSAQDKVKIDSLEAIIVKPENDTLLLQALTEISKMYLGYDYNKSIEYGLKASKKALKIQSIKYIAKSYHSIASGYFGMSDFKSAASNFFNALKYYEMDKDSIGMVYMQVNLGAVYDRLGEFDKALTYYLKARELIGQVKYNAKLEIVMPSLYNNIGNIYQTKNEVQSARQYYEKALRLANDIGLKQVQGIANNNLGKLYLNELNQPDSAFYYLQNGMKIRQEQGDKSEISKSYNLLANYYLKQHQFEKAKEAIKKAIDLSEQVGSLEQEKFAYSSLSEIEEALGNFQASLRAYKTFKNLSDSIQNQLAGSEITKLQFQYDFEKAEQLREQEKKETRLRYTIIIIALGAGLLVALLIALVVRSRARHGELKRKSLVQDMEIKNKELTTNVMYLIRKNELINDVAERLLQLQNSSTAENQKVIHDIIMDLQKEADNDIWKEFELRFNQVHSDFYNKLRSLYPGLSPADEKLCAFLRLNMSSKEIAAITQQSVKSVEVARARLRKKLNLTNTNSNLVTYLSGL